MDLAERGRYASGIAVTIGGVHQIVFVRTGSGEVVSLLPSGELSWKHAWKPGAIAMPLFVPPNRIFASTGDDVGSILLEVGTESGKASAREIWSSRAMKNHFSSSVLVGDQIYGFDNATLKCVAVATGEQRWVQRGFGKGHMVVLEGLLEDGRLTASDERTQTTWKNPDETFNTRVILHDIAPDGFQVDTESSTDGGKTWTTSVKHTYKRR